MIGGVAGAGIAVGPIVGGWATTELTWRIVFVGEVFIAAFILFMTRKVKDAPGPDSHAEARRRRLGAVGRRSRTLRLRRARIEHLGMGQAKNSPITIFGFSLTLFVIAAGVRPALGLRHLAAPPRSHRSATRSSTSRWPGSHRCGPE